MRNHSLAEEYLRPIVILVAVAAGRVAFLYSFYDFAKGAFPSALAGFAIALSYASAMLSLARSLDEVDHPYRERLIDAALNVILGAILFLASWMLRLGVAGFEQVPAIAGRMLALLGFGAGDILAVWGAAQSCFALLELRDVRRARTRKIPVTPEA